MEAMTVSLFDKIFKKGPKEQKYIQMMNGMLPVFSQFGTNIYASDVVQQVLKCIVDELKKLQPTHIRQQDTDPIPVKGNVQNILNNPNPTMTTTEFLEKISYMLLMNYNVFIIPTYEVWTEDEVDASGNRIKVERRRYEALWPIKPTQVDFIEDAAGRIYVKFTFANGYTSTINYNDVIHIKYNFSVNDFMGGNEMGQPDHQALIQTLDLNHTLLQGVAKAMKASYAVNAVVKYNTLMDEGKTQKALTKLERKLMNNESGFLPIDIKSEFIPIEKKIALIDKPTLEFVDSKILRTWRVPLCILQGDYTPQQYEAFYQSCLEPIIISMSQAFTKKIFTQRQISFGNQIMLYPEALVFMTMDQKLRMIENLSPTGGLFENEKRAIFGMRPDPELIGKRYISLNWIEANQAIDYQLGKVGATAKKEDEEEN
jgi:HK97 family phage portal protein